MDAAIGLTAGSRLYQAIVQAGSSISRLVSPSSTSLGEPLGVNHIHRRSARRADPVVLIGGYASMPESLVPLKESLERDGIRRVFIFEVPANGLADIRYSAAQLAAFIRRVLRETGALRVDLVAHSAGGIVARQFVQELGGAGQVDSLVTIATPHHGVVLAGVDGVNSLARTSPLRWLLGPATEQLLLGSALLRRLNSAPAISQLQRVRVTSIYVDGFDGLLLPTDTAVLQGARNIRLRHPGQSLAAAQLGHFSLHRRSSRVYSAVRDALLG